MAAGVSSHEHLEADLLGSSETAPEDVASPCDHGAVLAVHRLDLLERVDGIGPGEHPGDTLLTRLEHVHHEAARLDYEVEQV